MDSSRYLITGANGQLGKALAAELPDAAAFDRAGLDIANRSQVDKVDWSQYDVIINAAAYVNADHSETAEGRRLAWENNATGVRNLVRAAIRHDIHLIHFSSEYVLDGDTKNHNEDEPYAPLSVYGQSKAAADLLVSLVAKHHILRTTWVVGDGHNFVNTMHSLADMGIDPKVVDDQYGRLTFVSELVRAVRHILDNSIESGVYNLSNSGKIRSWAEMASLTFEMAGQDANRVSPVSTQEYAKGKMTFAPRPKHSDLDLSKINSTGFKSRDYEPLLHEYVQSLEKESKR